MWYQTDGQRESPAHLGFFIPCYRFLMLRRADKNKEKVNVFFSGPTDRKYWRQDTSLMSVFAGELRKASMSGGAKFQCLLSLSLLSSVFFYFILSIFGDS